MAVLCLPADWLGALWFAYHLTAKEGAHSQTYSILIFTTYMIVAGFGPYMWVLASVLWSILIYSDARGLTKGIASALLLLALLGTFKAGWVIGLRP
ncbi:MAG TPA: hypothetical protein VJW94_18710 [Candidatus Acidoferrum sp.]|nr:hypothetical protein [Candidatus Acidoferrum sp.]